MSEAKEELDAQKEKVILKMKEWEQDVFWAKNETHNLRIADQTPAGPELNAKLEAIEEKLTRAVESIQKADNNLEYLSNYFDFQKSNFDVRKIILDSWPQSRFTEKVLWVATILFSVGGATFVGGMVLTSGDVAPSLVGPVLMWGVGFSLMFLAIRELWRTDKKLMRFYEREFGVKVDLITEQASPE